jgi:hypothetical protein
MVGIVKHGVGEVLPEPDDQQKSATANWTAEDAAELAAEDEEKVEE